jgi:hypothetical protein
MLPRRRWTRISVTGGALAVVAALAAAPAAQGAAPWLSAQGLSPSGQQAADVQLAVNPNGSAVAVWDARAGSSWVVTAAARPYGGTWGPAQPLSGPLAGGPGLPDVAIDGEGNAVAVWNVAAATPPATAVQTAVLPAATGVWRPSVTLAEGASGAQVAMDAAGTAVAGWNSSAANTVQVRVRATGTAVWSDAERVAPTGATNVALAANAGGTFAAAWTSGTGVGATVRPPGGAWGAQELVPGGVAAQPPLRIGLDPQGNAYLLQSAAPSYGQSLLQGAVRPSRGPWGGFQRISTAGAGPVADVQLAVTGQGEALAAWDQPPGGSGASRAFVSSRPAGGSAWGAPQGISPTGQAGGVAGLAANASGAAVLGWVRPPGAAGPGTLQAEVRPAPNQQFGATETASGTGAVAANTGPNPPGAPQLGEDGKGTVVAVWAGANGRVLTADRQFPPGNPADVTLSKNQLLINQRISQFAVRQANALRTRLVAGLSGQDIRDGGMPARVFAPQVTLGGAQSGAFVAPNAGRPVPLPPAQPGDPSEVTLSKTQLLINQRISQAAVRRANAVQALLSGGLTGGDVVDGALSAAKLAPLLQVVSAAAGATPAPGANSLAAADQGQPTGNPASVTLSKSQLLINQRISQAAVRRTTALRAQLAAGLGALSFQGATIGRSDLSAPPG